jgi:hypothetical protein
LSEHLWPKWVGDAADENRNANPTADLHSGGDGIFPQHFFHHRLLADFGYNLAKLSKAFAWVDQKTILWIDQIVHLVR